MKTTAEVRKTRQSSTTIFKTPRRCSTKNYDLDTTSGTVRRILRLSRPRHCPYTYNLQPSEGSVSGLLQRGGFFQLFGGSRSVHLTRHRECGGTVPAAESASARLFVPVGALRIQVPPFLEGCHGLTRPPRAAALQPPGKCHRPRPRPSGEGHAAPRAAEVQMHAAQNPKDLSPNAWPFR